MMGSRGAAAPNPTKHKANARPTTPTDATRTANLNSANTVTKDFLVLSQPFMHAGLLIASASSGRRWYVHHLSEIPLSEVFLTKTGNQLQRIDNETLMLASSISIKVAQPPAPLPVPSVRLTREIATEMFNGDTEARDRKVVSLLNRGKEANEASDFTLACACFEAAYALSVRAGMLVSAANMRLKLGMAATALHMYRHVLSECSLLPAEAQMASRKLSEAQAALRDAGLDESGASSGLLGGASASPAALATAPPAADGFDSAFAPADDSFGSFGGGGADEGFGAFGSSGNGDATEGFGAFGSSGNGDATAHAATGHAADDAFGDFDAAFAQPPQASAFVQPPAATDIGFGSFGAQGICSSPTPNHFSHMPHPTFFPYLTF